MKNKSLHTAITYCFLILGLVLFLSGCKTKKVVSETKKEDFTEVIRKSEIETKQEDRKTEEKGTKTTEETTNVKADKKTETSDAAGNKTIIYENYYKGTDTKINEAFERSIIESLKSIIDKQSETNSKLFTEIKTLQQKDTQLKNSLIYGSIIVGGLILLIIILGVLNRFNLISFKRREKLSIKQV